MVYSFLPKNVFFSAHVCMYNAAYIFQQWQILFPIQTVDSYSSLGSVVLWLSRGGFITEGHLPLKVVLHRRSSSTEGRQWSSTKGGLPPKVVFHQRWSSTEVCLPLKVVLHQRSSSTIGRPKILLRSLLGKVGGWDLVWWLYSQI